MKIDSHSNLWKKIGERLLKDFEALHKSEYLDTGMKGRRGEGYFRKWLSLWLPKKIELVEGVIVEKDTNPTDQRDVIIFDSLNCPIFKEDNDGSRDINILPIEGVIGTIEINSSTVKVDKIIKDIEKISEIKKFKPLSEPPKAICFKPPPEPDIKDCYSIQMQKLGYVFALDCEVSLATLADRVKAKNLGLGMDHSIDAIFILNKGCILHGNDNGWTTTRLSEQNLFYMEMEPWDVLLTLVSMINHHLALGARGNIPSLEEYFQSKQVDRKSNMLKKRACVSNQDEAYSKQSSRFLAKQ